MASVITILVLSYITNWHGFSCVCPVIDLEFCPLIVKVSGDLQTPLTML